jgi:MYXO-CTERM domain-containing protein
VPLDLYGAGAVSLISWLVVLVGLGGAAWKRRRRAGQI